MVKHSNSLLDNRLSSTCLVTMSRNRYSVPCELAGKLASARLYPGRVCVVADDVIVASHERVGANTNEDQYRIGGIIFEAASVCGSGI